ncbi:MAG TPA: TonB-dependent receptor, partial [Ignavibacteriaceae bacterium]|nr:TonB-dependent receptor [Ignavibacteriaceae bacterium]
MNSIYKMIIRGSLLSFIVAGLSFTQPNSEQDNQQADNTTRTAINDTTIKMYDFPQIDVIGRKPSLLMRIPGSADIIASTSLKNTQPLAGNEMFRLVTGVHVVDEEGIGLRANIGIRGLDPDRSRTILMMEDGVPIALAPYGEPEMYYTPAIDRMKSVEILKGSGSILFGPQTIGGVINYVTADPPLVSTAGISLRGGTGGFASGQLSYGTTFDNVGVQVALLHKRADKLGITRFTVNDLTAKVRFNLTDNSRLGFKLAAYDEVSNSTYIGITQTMYDRGEYYTEVAPNDELDIRRYSASFTYDYFISDNSYIRTTAFGYTTTRNWLRQNFSRTTSSGMTGIIFGDTTITNGAIYMRNSTGNRNRQFEVAGIEPRFITSYNLGSLNNELETGFRFLYERAFEQRIDGRTADAKSGDLREDEIRTGYASSFFIQNRIFITEKFTVVPGFRLEQFNFSRDIFRREFSDTSLTANDDLFSAVPGAGLNYNFDNRFSVFTGVHRGFAPPRVKDAISSGGEALQLDAELSWNYEIGLRASLLSYLAVELTGYMLDFSNQVIPVSESSGGAGTGLVNGGSTLHQGVEAGIRFDLGSLLGSSYGIMLSTSATFASSEYNEDRFITVNSERVNIKGNKLPYSPEQFISASLDFSTPFGFGLQLSGTFIGEQFTDELNTTEASASGETGLMPSYNVV